MKAKYRIVMLFAIALFLIVGDVFGDENVVLKGIKSVEVYISETNLTATQISQLQTDVELKLRLAGIKVDPRSSQRLIVEVDMTEITRKSSKEVVLNYAIVQVYLAERVLLLSRNQETSVLARTWQGSKYTLHGPQDDFWKRCRDCVRDRTDEFINAYLSTNPK